MNCTREYNVCAALWTSKKYQMVRQFGAIELHTGTGVINFVRYYANSVFKLLISYCMLIAFDSKIIY